MFQVFKTVAAAALNAGTGADNQRQTAMEGDTILKHRWSSKSQTSRGKLNLFLLFFLMTSAVVLSSCGKEKDDKDKLPEYILIDENLGDEVDFAILGLDGFGYFYKFQDENPNIPKRLSIYDGNNEKVELIFNFNEDGMPSNILTDELTIVLGGFEGNKFSAVVIPKSGARQTLENIETDFCWDEYKSEISGGIARSSMSSIQTKSSSFTVKLLNTAASTVACFYGSLISCGSYISNLLEIGGVQTPQILKDIFFLDSYAGLYSCGANHLLCLANMVSLVLYEVDSKENSAANALRIGEGILGTGVRHTGGPGVYIAGREGNYAVLWKNGVTQYLTDGTFIAEAFSVFVVGNDVYVAGTERNQAKIWINGVGISLTDGNEHSSSGYSVFVSGNDVYVAGSFYAQLHYANATIWKNGIMQPRLSGGSFASSVFVSGNNVYVVGETELLGNRGARLWINGVVQYRPMTVANYLTDINGFASASSVFVVNNVVYVAGVRQRVSDGPVIATLWRNGIAQNLIGTGVVEANSVFVAGNDTYVAGGADGGAHLWKNGVAQILPDGSRATSVAVSGSDVYVVGHTGYSPISNRRARMWKNGIVQNISTLPSHANAIFIVD